MHWDPEVTKWAGQVETQSQVSMFSFLVEQELQNPVIVLNEEQSLSLQILALFIVVRVVRV